MITFSSIKKKNCQLQTKMISLHELDITDFYKPTMKFFINTKINKSSFVLTCSKYFRIRPIKFLKNALNSKRQCFIRREKLFGSLWDEKKQICEILDKLIKKCTAQKIKFCLKVQFYKKIASGNMFVSCFHVFDFYENFFKNFIK